MNTSSSKLLYIVNKFNLFKRPFIVSQFKTEYRHPRISRPSLYHNQNAYFYHSVENYIKLKSKDLHVNAGFGTLHANGSMDFIIKPTNVQEYPDADKAFVNIYGPSSSTSEGINIELTGELHDILTITASPKSSDLYCEVMLPIKYDLDLHLLNKAGVQICGMEADEVKVSTESGEIRIKGLKSHNIHFNTEEGNITSEGSIQGNIFINAKKTHFTAKRLQGMMLDIEAEELSTAVECSYMNQGQISAQRGQVKLNNLHGCTDLMVRQGSIIINGFHGQISGFVGSGRIEAQVTDVTGLSTLHLTEGHLALSILDSPRHNIDVSAPDLEVSDEVKSLGSLTSATNFTITQPDLDVSQLEASVKNGTARVTCQNWFSTLGIKLERES